MKIGLYFGSFNPVHNGHLIIANHVLNETEIKKIWFVVSPQNPFKAASTLLRDYDRLHLMNLAIEGDDRLKSSDIEFLLPKPSFTAPTLSYLKEKYPEHQFTLIMGSDSFKNLDKWKNVESIVKHYSIIVYTRPGFEVNNSIQAQVTVMDAPLLQISATYIRQLVQQNKSIKYLVPGTVEEEILKSRFFKDQKK